MSGGRRAGAGEHLHHQEGSGAEQGGVQPVGGATLGLGSHSLLCICSTVSIILFCAEKRFFQRSNRS